MPVIHALGTTVNVDVDERLDGVRFAQAWSRCLRTPEPLSRSIGADDTVRVSGPMSMASLTQAVTRALIERRAGELLMLHAGAVSHPRTGASIAYVAPGGTGKTTLTALLARRYGYLTDETVGVDPVSRLIHPYPKPLSTRTRAGGFPKDERGPDDLGLVPAHPAPVLTQLVLLRRDPGGVEPRCTRLDLLDAVMAVVPETSSLSRLERPLHLLADLYAALDGFWLVEYAEAADLVPWVGERLGEP